MTYSLVQNNTDKKQRADVLLTNAYPQYSRAALTKLFNMGLVKNEVKQLKPGDKIQPNNSVYADVSPIEKVADSIDMPIMYQDENIIVVNKPAGVISHARGRYWDEPSVASFIREKVSGFEGERAGIVHRLDRATSGVMVCAKNPETLSYLQKQFSNRTVSKTYVALVNGLVEPKKGLIDVPLSRNPNKPQTFIVSASGKPAQTKYIIISNQDNISAVKLQPLTGRTHQLRIHMQYINKPIIGDVLYNGDANQRLMLHAHTISINVPNIGKKTFIAPIPKEFIKLCKQLSTL